MLADLADEFRVAGDEPIAFAVAGHGLRRPAQPQQRQQHPGVGPVRHLERICAGRPGSAPPRPAPPRRGRAPSGSRRRGPPCRPGNRSASRAACRPGPRRPPPAPARSPMSSSTSRRFWWYGVHASTRTARSAAPCPPAWPRSGGRVTCGKSGRLSTTHLYSQSSSRSLNVRRVAVALGQPPGEGDEHHVRPGRRTRPPRSSCRRVRKPSFRSLWASARRTASSASSIWAGPCSRARAAASSRLISATWSLTAPPFRGPPRPTRSGPASRR